MSEEWFGLILLPMVSYSADGVRIFLLSIPDRDTHTPCDAVCRSDVLHSKITSRKTQASQAPRRDPCY